MTESTNVEQHSPELDILVSSFEVGIMTFKGAWTGICIKFSMHDYKTKTTHWSPHAYRLLIKALEAYCENLGENAFMFRAKANPSLVESLPPRHPYRTLLLEVPTLTLDEIGTPSPGSSIGQAAFVDRGRTFELRPEYGDSRTENILLHEYTALSLLGYLQEYIEAAKKLTGPAGGNA